MTEKMRFGVIAVLVVFIALALSWSCALPLNQKEKRKAADTADTSEGSDKPASDSKEPAVDGGAQPATVPPANEVAVGEGCFVFNEEVLMMTVYELDTETRQYVAKNETLTRTVRSCCEGYTGVECDQKLDIIEPDTCGNLTCEGDPNAYCAVVKKCGKEIPLFLDENGLPSKKCNQSIDLSSLSCSGVCKQDPCLNAQCIGYPSATCFPIGCECKAVWLIYDEATDENVEVNCASENGKTVRQKRDTSCIS